MTGFSISWLDLREPADVKARSKLLAQEAIVWLENNSNGFDNILVDLGSGTGSTLRTLTTLGARNIIWRLVDNDGQLLDEALKRHSKQALIEAYQADLTLIDELPFGGAKLVTASALFDLVSREFVDSLLDSLSSQKTALYVALNYDGNIEWTPSHPFDATVLNAFNQDQRKDKGFGKALGPDATEYLQQILESKNYKTSTASSPWQLNATNHELVSELIEGIVGAVENDYGLIADDLTAWKEFRIAHASSGTCNVGHLDLLALPF